MAEHFDREDIEAVAACLGDDAAQMRGDNDEDERASNMDRAASMLTWMLLTQLAMPFPAALSDALAFIRSVESNDTVPGYYRKWARELLAQGPAPCATTAHAFAIADEAMFELLHSEAVPYDSPVDEANAFGLVDEQAQEVATLDRGFARGARGVRVAAGSWLRRVGHRWRRSLHPSDPPAREGDGSWVTLGLRCATADRRKVKATARPAALLACSCCATPGASSPRT